MLVGKATLAVGLIKITWYKGVNIFSEQKSLERRVKVELDLYNYATKADLKNATGIDTSKFAKNIHLANLKSNVDELDIDKLKNAPTKKMFQLI